MSGVLVVLEAGAGHVGGARRVRATLVRRADQQLQVFQGFMESDLPPRSPARHLWACTSLPRK